MDRIDANAAMQSGVLSGGISSGTGVGRSIVAEFQAPDMVPVYVREALPQPEGAARVYKVIEHTMLCRSLCGAVPVVLYQGDYWPLKTCDRTGAAYIVVEGYSMADLTLEQKQAKYRAGAYMFPAPPVYAGGWSEQDWIRYIDLSGRWL